VSITLRSLKPTWRNHRITTVSGNPPPPRGFVVRHGANCVNRRVRLPRNDKRATIAPHRLGYADVQRVAITACPARNRPPRRWSGTVCEREACVLREIEIMAGVHLHPRRHRDAAVRLTRSISSVSRRVPTPHSTLVCRSRCGRPVAAPPASSPHRATTLPCGFRRALIAPMIAAPRVAVPAASSRGLSWTCPGFTGTKVNCVPPTARIANCDQLLAVIALELKLAPRCSHSARALGLLDPGCWCAGCPARQCQASAHNPPGRRRDTSVPPPTRRRVGRPRELRSSATLLRWTYN